MADQPFVTDMQTLRARARQHIEHGAVTAGYRADRDTVIRLFNEALATEIVCVLRSKRHCFLASGIKAQSVAQECLPHATDEQAHADQMAQRIVQLGDAPHFSPEGLSTRSHSEYGEGGSLVDMMKEDLVAERIAIDSYREMITYFGTADPTTRRLMEGILAMEEEHAEDVVRLLEALGSSGPRARPWHGERGAVRGTRFPSWCVSQLQPKEAGAHRRAPATAGHDGRDGAYRSHRWWPC